MRAFEGAGIHLEGVARVQHHHRPALVVSGRRPASVPAWSASTAGARPACGLHGGLVHADDLALDLHAAAWRSGSAAGPALLRRRGRPAAVVLVQPLRDPGRARRPRRSGEEQVDAFGGEQHGAPQRVLGALAAQRVAPLGQPVERARRRRHCGSGCGPAPAECQVGAVPAPRPSPARGRGGNALPRPAGGERAGVRGAGERAL